MAKSPVDRAEWEPPATVARSNTGADMSQLAQAMASFAPAAASPLGAALSDAAGQQVQNQQLFAGAH
jgi:hypothetical protein